MIFGQLVGEHLQPFVVLQHVITLRDSFFVSPLYIVLDSVRPLLMVAIVITNCIPRFLEESIVLKKNKKNKNNNIKSLIFLLHE